MEQFKKELELLLSRFPQVESVSYTMTNTISQKDVRLIPMPTPLAASTAYMPPVESGKPNLEATLAHLQAMGKAGINDAV